MSFEIFIVGPLVIPEPVSISKSDAKLINNTYPVPMLSGCPFANFENFQISLVIHCQTPSVFFIGSPENISKVLPLILYEWHSILPQMLL